MLLNEQESIAAIVNCLDIIQQVPSMRQILTTPSDLDYLNEALHVSNSHIPDRSNIFATNLWVGGGKSSWLVGRLLSPSHDLCTVY